MIAFVLILQCSLCGVLGLPSELLHLIAAYLAPEVHLTDEQVMAQSAAVSTHSHSAASASLTVTIHHATPALGSVWGDEDEPPLSNTPHSPMGAEWGEDDPLAAVPTPHERVLSAVLRIGEQHLLPALHVPSSPERRKFAASKPGSRSAKNATRSPSSASKSAGNYSKTPAPRAHKRPEWGS
jgi:hypothetical protein